MMGAIPAPEFPAAPPRCAECLGPLEGGAALQRGQPYHAGCWLRFSERVALAEENARLRAFLERDVLPRYMELFEGAGLGRRDASVIYQRAAHLLLGEPAPVAREGDDARK